MADDERSARQISRSKQRAVGDRSAQLALTLMKLSAAEVNKLELEDGLREAVDRARAVTSPIARRRAERTLAGDVRRFDIADLAAQLARIADSANADVRHFHAAEKWRAQLIEQGIAAAAEFPGGPDEQLSRLVEVAQRAQMTGKPPGAARALFRYIVDRLKKHQVPTTL